MRNRLLIFFGEFICRRPWLVVMIALLLAAISAMYAATSLRLNANLDDLVSRDRPYMREYRQFLEEFGDLEYIILAVSAAADRSQAEHAVDALLDRLNAIPGLEAAGTSRAVHGAIEPEEQLRMATRAMPDDQLENLAAASGALPALRTADGPHIVATAEAMLSELVSRGSAMSQSAQQRTAAGAIMLLQAIAAAKDGSSREALAFLIEPPGRQYLASETGDILFINILPAKDYSTLSVIAEPLAAIRRAIEDVREDFPDVPIGLTGKPVMQYDEMATSNADMTRAALVAFILCAGLFMLMLGGWRRPLLAIIAFGAGAAWTYGFATLAVGQLNLLSIVFMLVLIGVGLDYGVHVINRYQEFRAPDADVHSAIVSVFPTAVRGNITGALTSSTVFFLACFTTFQGLRELGLIAGMGLLLCLVAMCTVLPALLRIFESNAPARVRARELPALQDQAHNTPRRRSKCLARLILLGAAAITLILLLAPGRLRFDYNLLNLQADNLESVKWERRIVADSASASWFGASVAATQAEAQELIQRAKTRPTIGAVHSIFDIVQPDTPRRDASRAALHVESQPRFANAQTPDVAVSMSQASARLRAIVAAAALQGANDEAATFTGLAAELDRLDARSSTDLQAIDQTLQAIQRSLAIIIEGDRLPLREALPNALRDQFVSPSGRFLIMLHPARDVWEYEPMKAFIADLRAVDPDVTGVPITHFESLNEMHGAFVLMSSLALCAIIVLLAIDFRSPRDVLLALAPLILGMIWTVETMGLLGISFNLANFFAAPMLIGLGVDSAVHMLHRAREAEVNGDLEQPLRFGRTKRAVILSGLTTIIGFGALLMGHHRGLRSLGIVMAIGSTACMLASIVVLPAMLSMLPRGARPGAKAVHAG